MREEYLETKLLNESLKRTVEDLKEKLSKLELKNERLEEKY